MPGGCRRWPRKGPETCEQLPGVWRPCPRNSPGKLIGQTNPGGPAEYAGQSVQPRACEPYLGLADPEESAEFQRSPELAHRLQRRMRDGDERRTRGPKPR